LFYKRTNIAAFPRPFPKKDAVYRFVFGKKRPNTSVRLSLLKSLHRLFCRMLFYCTAKHDSFRVSVSTIHYGYWLKLRRVQYINDKDEYLFNLMLTFPPKRDFAAKTGSAPDRYDIAKKHLDTLSIIGTSERRLSLDTHTS
jgi:hypothetical protein